MPRKLPKLKTLRNRLDKVCREYVKLRDGNICQTCGIHKDSTPEGTVDWCHLISRKVLVTRWMQKATLTQCRKCHRAYGDGFNIQMIKAIDRKWGDGTCELMEQIAREHPTSKTNYLHLPQFRIELEEYYKKLIHCMKNSTSPTIAQECMDSEMDLEGWGIILNQTSEEQPNGSK